MLIIGHRGAAGQAPENTLEALRVGHKSGAEILEFDVRLTSDGVPVVIHDATTDRTHHTHMAISRTSSVELRARTAEKPIPTLEEVLDEFFGKVMLNIELKAPGSGWVVAELVIKHYITRGHDWDHVIFSSRKASELRGVKQVSQHARLSLLHDQNPLLFVGYHRKLNLSAVGWHKHYVDPLALEIAKKLGLFTYVYTVNRVGTAQLLKGKGIDAIVTDYPDRLCSSK